MKKSKLLKSLLLNLILCLSIPSISEGSQKKSKFNLRIGGIYALAFGNLSLQLDRKISKRHSIGIEAAGAFSVVHARASLGMYLRHKQTHKIYFRGGLGVINCTYTQPMPYISFIWGKKLSRRVSLEIGAFYDFDSISTSQNSNYLKFREGILPRFIYNF